MKKLLIGIAVFILLLAAAVVAVPFLFKDKINARVKAEINEQVNAKVDYGDFSLSLIRSFPNFSFSINDVSVVGVDSFKGDTLIYIKNFNFTVDLMSVIEGGKYKLLAVDVVSPVINAKVNYAGKANWDILKPSSSSSASSSSSNFSLEIKKYAIENANITYDDKKGNAYAEIDTLNFSGSGNVTNALYDFVTKTSIAELTYKSGAVAYLNKAKLDAAINLSVDNANSKYTFKENSVNLNDLGLSFDGYVQTKKDETDLDVNFKSQKTEFKSILSLIPAVYKKDFDKIQTSGSLALNGNVKGIYAGENYPALTFNLNVNNGMFQYPSLPVAVKNIFIAANVAKPQGGLDLTVVDISKLHLEAASDPIDATVKVKTPISDPNVAANINGKLDLATVPKFYPMDGLKTLSGLLALNLNFNGKKSDVDKKNYQAISASGNAKVTNLVYDSKETPMPVRVNDLQLTFNPKNVALNSLSAAIGKSDFNATGTLDNFVGYAFGKGDLSGTLNLRSTQIDANEWLAKDNSATTQTAKTDTAKTQYFKVPAHIDFTANSQIGKILYEKIILENVKGQISVKDEAINLSNLFANVFGGSATISAKYSTKATDHPDVTFAYDIKNFDIQKTYQGVGMAAKIAPVIKYIQGNFSSSLSGVGKLNPDMSVDYNSLTGEGKISIPDAKIVNLPILAKVTEVAKIPALENLEIKNQQTSLTFKNGRVNVAPTDLKFGNGYDVNIQGSNGFDQTINYDMQMNVPSKNLGAAASVAQSALSKIPGLGSALPDVVSFTLNITGTVEKPVIKLSKVGVGAGSAKSVASNVANNLKQQAQQQVTNVLQNQKQNVTNQAKDAVNQVKDNASQQIKNIFKLPK